MSSSKEKASTPKFSHRFSGISVWLEPDPLQTPLLLKEMDYLSQQCGGPEAGMHRITPHCTLLYNTSFPCHDDISLFNLNAKSLRRQQDAEDLLRRCLRDYCLQANTERRDCSSETRCIPKIKLMPTSHYYFPYPNTADDGKGFGCCISLIILEKTPELKRLQEIVKSIFPPDERHGGGHRRTNQQNHNSKETEEEVKFQPHMALVYAPEDHPNVTSGWLEEYTSQAECQKKYSHWASADDIEKTDGIEGNDCVAETECERKIPPAPAWDSKYISVWSTEGTMDEWFPIAKIDLEVKFQPHMALVYAPEDHPNVTSGWLEKKTPKRNICIELLNSTDDIEKADGGKIEGNGCTAEMECESRIPPASAAWDSKYLSVWSTEGRMDECFSLAKVDLVQK